MAAIKTYFRVTNPRKSLTGIYAIIGKVGELVEYRMDFVVLDFGDIIPRAYFHDEVEPYNGTPKINLHPWQQEAMDAN